MRAVNFCLKTMELYLMQMKHKTWSYFVKRFFDNKPAWRWWGSYHHWDPWCQAKISVLGWQRRGDRHYRWYEQKAEESQRYQLTGFLRHKRDSWKKFCACSVRVKLRLLIQYGVFKNNFHWSGFQMYNIGNGNTFPFPGTPFGNGNTFPFPNTTHWKQKHISISQKWKQDNE